VSPKSDRPSLTLPIETYLASLRAYVTRRDSARAEDEVIHREMAESLREDATRRRSRIGGKAPTSKPKA
jgi:hypothetical protein